MYFMGFWESTRRTRPQMAKDPREGGGGPHKEPRPNMFWKTTRRTNIQFKGINDLGIKLTSIGITHGSQAAKSEAT